MDFCYGFCQRVKVILPFLACIALIYSWKSQCLFLIEGHHVDTETVLLRLIQSATFVAPATVWLVQVVSYGPVLCMGVCFVVLGITVPSLFADTHQQEVAFAILYGTGTSIMFQAASMTASLIFRENIVWSFVMLGLTATVMSLSQRLFELAMVKFAEHLLLGLLVLIPVICVFPTCVSVLRTLNFETKVAYPELGQTTNKDQTNSKYEELTQISHNTKNECSAFEVDTENIGASSWSLIINDLKWRLCALLWWATGVHLSYLSSTSTDFSTNMKTLSMMCIFSIFTFGIKIFLTARTKSTHNSDVDSNCAPGYFMLGLLGISGIILQMYPLTTDVRYQSLLLSMGLFHQLKTSDVFHKVPLDVNKFCWMINQICIELIFTFCALVIGYHLAMFVCCINVAPVITKMYFSDISFSGLSMVMILLSLRYCIRREQTSLVSTGSDYSGQTC